MNTVRKFSPVGPCIEQGTVVGETPKFYSIKCRFTGSVKRIGKRWDVHTQPCVSCRDHERTQYPDGYMD